MSRRDLSAFDTAPAPATASVATPRATSKPARRRTPPRKRPRPPTSTRITLSLPIATAEALRERASAEATFYLDVVLHCHRRDLDATAATDDAEGFRRRAPAGRIQIPLNIATADLRSIDASASAMDLSRSNYLTVAIDRYVAG